MAGKIKPMSQIKQLLQLHKQGESIKSTAKNLGISRNTVKAYLAKFKDLNVGIDMLLALDDPILEKKFHAGNPAYKDNRFEEIKNDIHYYEKELKRNGVNRKLLWEEYKVVYPDGYGYTQFCHHLNQQIIAKKPSMVLNHKPGEKLFVDFAGKKIPYIDRETGEIIECQVFVACLPYSDYAFVMAVKSQSIVDFLHALKCCLEYFQGVPEILVPDNLKSAITKASKYEPEVNRALEDFCNHYGMAIVPARVAKPKDKALVENQVKLIYTRIYAKLRNQQFFDLTSLNQAILEKLKCHNQTRMQLKPYCREEKFIADEKPLLKPLPDTPYEIKFYKTLKGAVNNHIQLTCDLHYYSFPYKYIGEQLKVIYTGSIVRIYAKGEMIATHPRNYAVGKYTTVNEHLCSYHQHYLKRSPAYYIEQAENKSTELVELIKLLFKKGNPPEQNYRTCDGFFNLYRKTSPDIFNMACKHAIECKKYSYKFVLNIIENNKKTFPKQEDLTEIPNHKNVRGKAYYEQLSFKF